MYIIYALLSAFFAALTTIAGKIALDKVNPSLLATLKAFTMTAILAIFLSITEKDTLKNIQSLQGKTLLGVLIVALTGALSWVFSYYALKAGSAYKVSAIDKTSIIMILVMSIFVLEERFSWYNVVGIILISVGGYLAII